MTGFDGTDAAFLPVVPLSPPAPPPEHVVEADVAGADDDVEIRVTGQDGTTYSVTLPPFRSAQKPRPVRDDSALDE